MRAGRIAMGILYVAAGIAHFVAMPMYVAITPDYLPAHRVLVALSGLAEIIGGLCILFPAPEIISAAAWGIILLLIAVFPANLWMLQHPERFPNVPLWALWLRLPLQLILIAWAWCYTRRPAEWQATAQG